MDVFTDEDSSVSISLKIAESDLNYSSTGLGFDDVMTIAGESPTFRGIFESLLRSRHGSDPIYEWFRTHLGRMDTKSELVAEPVNKPKPDLGVEELIEMLRLQAKVNESYAKLAILLGEAYVGKAKR